jgi:hypothetical protein
LPCPCLFGIILDILEAETLLTIDFDLEKFVDVLNYVLPSSKAFFSLENFFEERQKDLELILRS